MVSDQRSVLARIKAEIREVEVGEAERLRASGAVLLDVREADEVEQGSVPGAMHIPRGFLEFRIEDTVSDRNQPIVVYCAGGARSAFAAKSLADLGYRDVVSLAGGFTGWKSAGKPWAVPQTLTAGQRRRYSR
nr:molybdopterin biosynthesis protein MoeB [Geodermatophilaceae bacterium]